MRSGTITVRRQRVRDVDERFASRLLPLFTRRTKEVLRVEVWKSVRTPEMARATRCSYLPQSWYPMTFSSNQS